MCYFLLDFTLNLISMDKFNILFLYVPYNSVIFDISVALLVHL